MISIIVPVYNVEPYLRKCLDSIINQTYKDLEMLIIDDGSTDGSGRICDEYAEKDSRITVFHTENRGLSCARNLGLDEAKGEWIGFVDSDDWIEPDMYEVLIRRAEETGADVVECGVFKEYSDKTAEHHRPDSVMHKTEAIHALVNRELSNSVWNKLWDKACYSSIRFPEGRMYEDVAITYRVFDSVDTICSISECKYHYLQREKSLTNKLSMKKMVDYWLAQRDKYDYLSPQADEKLSHALVRLCAEVAASTWAHCYDCSENERILYQETIQGINSFVMEYIPMFGERGWKAQLRLGIFFPHFNNGVSFRLAWLLNRISSTVFQRRRGYRRA